MVLASCRAPLPYSYNLSCSRALLLHGHIDMSSSRFDVVAGADILLVQVGYPVDYVK